ncbi:ankyrin repeat domain-containing protein 7-like [Prorops nasuta]|uniref:ankyrin repeat domain-containing protein 7-like n=1 Tax=Prorops nasuta TaxID=863751 RepID=UPI0034CEBF48
MIRACNEVNEKTLIRLLKFGCDEKIKEFVLQHAPSINMNYLDFNLKTPLSAAIDREDPEILCFLLANISTDLNDTAVQPSGRTVIMYASFKCNNPQMLEELLKKNANPRQTDICGWNSLQYAIAGEKIANVSYLLKYGLSKNFRDFKGQTPLMTAVLLSSLDIIKLLLNCKVDIDERDDVGLSAIQIAILYRKRDAILLLIQKGANMAQVTPLTNASLKQLSNTTMPKQLPYIQIEKKYSNKSFNI